MLGWVNLTWVGLTAVAGVSFVLACWQSVELSQLDLDWIGLTALTAVTDDRDQFPIIMIGPPDHSAAWGQNTTIVHMKIQVQIPDENTNARWKYKYCTNENTNTVTDLLWLHLTDISWGEAGGGDLDCLLWKHLGVISIELDNEPWWQLEQWGWKEDKMEILHWERISCSLISGLESHTWRVVFQPTQTPRLSTLLLTRQESPFPTVFKYQSKNIATGETSPAITPYHTYHFSISTSFTFITSKVPSQDDFHHLMTFITK